MENQNWHVIFISCSFCPLYSGMTLAILNSFQQIPWISLIEFLIHIIVKVNQVYEALDIAYFLCNEKCLTFSIFEGSVVALLFVKRITYEHYFFPSYGSLGGLRKSCLM